MMRNRHPRAHKHSQKQKGVGLLEILITVLLLSIGFLAAAKMQVQGMRFSQSAYIEAQAYFMISDMMDRMRSNAKGVRAKHYDNKKGLLSRIFLTGVQRFTRSEKLKVLFHRCQVPILCRPKPALYL